MKYILLSVLLITPLVFANDLRVIWKPPATSNYTGTMLYEVKCDNIWSAELQSATCSGNIIPSFLSERKGKFGGTACNVGWPGDTDTHCWQHTHANYFDGREGKICFAATAYLKDSDGTILESAYSPISCKVIASTTPDDPTPDPQPDPDPIPIDDIPAPLDLTIRLLCNPDCTVEIIE